MERYQGRSRAQRAEVILDAAIDVASRRGCARLTIDEVAAQAGVAKGTVYLHYAGKDAILLAIVERAIGQFAALLHFAATESTSPIEQLRSVFLQVASDEDGPSLFPLLLQSCASSSTVQQSAESVLTKLFDPLVPHIAEGQARGALCAEVESRTAAIALLVLALAPSVIQDHDTRAAFTADCWRFYDRAMRETSQNAPSLT